MHVHKQRVERVRMNCMTAQLELNAHTGRMGRPRMQILIYTLNLRIFVCVCVSSNALSICLPAGGILFERLTAKTCTEKQALAMSGGKTVERAL